MVGPPNPFDPRDMRQLHGLASLTDVAPFGSLFGLNPPVPPDSSVDLSSQFTGSQQLGPASGLMQQQQLMERSALERQALQAGSRDQLRDVLEYQFQERMAAIPISVPRRYRGRRRDQARRRLMRYRQRVRQEQRHRVWLNVRVVIPLALIATAHWWVLPPVRLLRLIVAGE